MCSFCVRYTENLKLSRVWLNNRLWVIFKSIDYLGYRLFHRLSRVQVIPQIIQGTGYPTDYPGDRLSHRLSRGQVIPQIIQGTGYFRVWIIQIRVISAYNGLSLGADLIRGLA